MQTRETRQGCPYCGEVLDLIIDESVPDQRYVEDCQVCCRPIDVATWEDVDGVIQVQLYRDDE
ncbi:MAG: CPXCG motif-containing cysteine-rich protein [Pseudomonadota bacterium]